MVELHGWHDRDGPRRQREPRLFRGGSDRIDGQSPYSSYSFAPTRGGSRGDGGNEQQPSSSSHVLLDPLPSLPRVTALGTHNQNHHGLDPFESSKLGLSRDAHQLEWRRAVKRMLAVSFLSAAIWWLFWYLWYHPFVMFTSKGLLTQMMTDNGPVLKISLGGVAESVFTKTHPFKMAFTFGFWFYMNVVVIPMGLPFLATVAAWLRLVPFLACCHPAPIDVETTPDGRVREVGNVGGSGTLAVVASASSSSSSSSSASSPSSSAAQQPTQRRRRRLKALNRWVASACAFIRDAYEVIQPWNTAEPCVMAVYFVSPNMDDISNWVFNTSTPQCEQIQKATNSAANCLTVYGSIRGGGGVCMFLWLACTVAVSAMALKHVQPPKRAPRRRRRRSKRDKAAVVGVGGGGGGGGGEGHGEGGGGDEEDGSHLRMRRMVVPPRNWGSVLGDYGSTLLSVQVLLVSVFGFWFILNSQISSLSRSSSA